MKAFGGGRIGGPALNAGGMVAQPLTGLPVGPIAALVLAVSFGLISTGSAFNLVVDTGSSTAAEGTDDLDLLQNAMLSLVTPYADADTNQGNLSLTRWRTLLGIFNTRDIDGVNNGVSVPASNASVKNFTALYRFPYSLASYFLDGDIGHQGSTRLKLGRYEYTNPSSLTPNVVLANGTAAVSALSIQMFPFAGNGTENDVGPVWQATAPSGMQTVFDLDPTQRIFVGCTSLASAIGSGPIDFGPFDKWSATQFNGAYQAQQLAFGGFDPTSRLTPLLYLNRNRRLQDFLAEVGISIHYDFASTNLSSVGLLDVKWLTPGVSTTQQIATNVGGGGAVSTAPLAPPSGQGIPAVLAHLVGQRFLPGKVNAPNVTVASGPAAVAANQAKTTANAGAIARTLGMFRRS